MLKPRHSLTTLASKARTLHRPLGHSTRLGASLQLRYSSHAPSPLPVLGKGLKPITIPVLHKLHADKIPITMLTAHYFPSALLAQEAGMDIILVGDSLAMVSLGMPDTSEVTLDEMIIHAKAVSRAANRSFTVGDLPMGSYEISPEQALGSS